MAAKSKSRMLLLTFKKGDATFGVSRETLVMLSKRLGMNEKQAVHYAFAKLAHKILPTIRNG